MQNRLNNDAQSVHGWRETAREVPLTLAPNVFASLDDYLAAVRRSLSLISEAEAQAILEEIRQHILLSAKGYEELGDAPDRALRNAIAAFGTPQELGRSFSTTYQTTGTARSLPPWVALRRALRVLVPTHALTMSIWLICTLLSRQQGIPPIMASAILCVVFLLIPAFAGWRIGTTPNTPRASFGTFLALSLMAFVSSPLLVLYLHLPTRYMPYTELVSLFPLLLVVWIPTACVMAGMANYVTQQATKRLRVAR